MRKTTAEVMRWEYFHTGFSLSRGGEESYAFRLATLPDHMKFWLQHNQTPCLHFYMTDKHKVEHYCEMKEKLFISKFCAINCDLKIS